MVGRVSLRRVILAVGLSAVSLWMVVGCRSVPFAAGLYVSKGKPFLIAESTEAYGWGVLSHPRIIALDGSNLIVRFYVGGESNPHEPGRRSLTGISPAVSHDGGKTWSFGETNLEERLALASRYWGYDARVAGGVVVSDDQGSNAVLVTNGQVREGFWQSELISSESVTVWPFHRAAQAPDGTLYAVGHRWTDWQGGVQRLQTWCLCSTNEARTWEVVSMVAGPEHVDWLGEWTAGFEGPGEPSIVCLRDGELLVVCRTGMKVRSRWDAPRSALRMLLARSRDGGKTWRRSCMNVEGVYPKLLRLSNGVLVLAFGRPGNNLIFSTDGGRTWGHELAITPADIRTSGYCDVAEVAPGRLLVVFDAHDMDLDGVWLWEPKKQNGLFGVFVNVRRVL